MPLSLGSEVSVISYHTIELIVGHCKEEFFLKIVYLGNVSAKFYTGNPSFAKNIFPRPLSSVVLCCRQRCGAFAR